MEHFKAEKRGLVLEGGAMRGLFSAGIMDVFMEHDITFDGLAGVSAGAAFGCNMKSRQIGRVLRYNKRFCRDKRYCSWYSWWKTGDLFGADFCYRELPLHLDPFDCRTFESDPMEYFVVCTDIHTGKVRYQQCSRADEECFEWMRASASMPLVSRPVHIGNSAYLDGALTDSIPLRFMESQGYEKNVVILTQTEHYRKAPQKGMPLLRLLLRKYPLLIRALENRHLLYNQELDHVREQERNGKCFVFRPREVLPAGRICHDPEKLQQTYDAGRECALQQLDALKSFLSETPL